MQKSFLLFCFYFATLTLLSLFFPEDFWALSFKGYHFWFATIPLLVFLIIKFGNIKLPLDDKSLTRPLSFANLKVEIFFMLIGSTVVAFLLWRFRFNFIMPPPFGRGDSLQLLEHLPIYTHLFGYLDSFDETLALYFHSKVYLFLYHSFQLESIYAYSIPSVIMGVIFFISLWLYLRKRTLYSILLGVTLFIFSPMVALFAGYVENYTLFALSLHFMLMMMVQFLEKRPSSLNLQFTHTYKEDYLYVIILAFFSAWSALVHLAAGAMILSLVLFVWYLSDKNPTRMFRLSVVAIITASLTFTSVWYYFFFIVKFPLSFNDSFLAHPALYHPSRFFSTKHLLDQINIWMLGNPVMILLPLLIPVFSFENHQPVFNKSPDRFMRIKKIISPTPTTDVMGLSALSYFLFFLIWNPVIGFPADWDLFTLSTIPLTHFLFVRFKFDPASGVENSKRILTQRESLRYLFSASLFSLIFACSWIYSNSCSDAISKRNYKTGQESVSIFLDRMKNDAFLDQLPDIARKRLYVKFTYFQLRSERILKASDDSRATLALRNLEADMSAVKKIILIDSHKFQEKMLPYWKSLGEINALVSELQSKP